MIAVAPQAQFDFTSQFEREQAASDPVRSTERDEARFALTLECREVVIGAMRRSVFLPSGCDVDDLFHEVAIKVLDTSSYRLQAGGWRDWFRCYAISEAKRILVARSKEPVIEMIREVADRDSDEQVEDEPTWLDDYLPPTVSMVLDRLRNDKPEWYRVIQLRLLTREPMSCRDIEDEMKMSKSWVCQAESDALEWMRGQMEISENEYRDVPRQKTLFK